MHKDNTPNFSTKLSKLTHYNDFINNSQDEKDELKKVKRSFTKNAEGIGTDIGNKTKYKYNKVTRKMDDNSLSEIKDDIKSIDELGVKNSKHKYEIASDLHQESLETNILDDLRSNFKSWETGHNSVESVNELTTILKDRHPKTDVHKLKQMAMDWCGCDVIEENNSNVKKFENFTEEDVDVKFESDDAQNYMFFGNLETIKRMVNELSEMDQVKVNNLLNDGHNWAEDHISSAKENISQVYDLIKSELN